MNNWFKKPERKPVTARNLVTKEKLAIAELEGNYTRETHDQVDFILAQRRWINSITNAETDPDANVDSDHFPVIANIEIKLKVPQKPSLNKFSKLIKPTKETIMNFNDKFIVTYNSQNLKTYQVITNNIKQTAEETWTKATKIDRTDWISNNTKILLDHRQHARDLGDIYTFATLTKTIKKYRTGGKRILANEMIKAEMDIRDKWMGIKRIKFTYQPNGYSRKASTGEHVPIGKIAEETATHLATEQWGYKTEKPQFRNTNRGYVPTVTPVFDFGPLRLIELKEILLKFKKHKAPGPDELPMDIIKTMNAAALMEIVELINAWWQGEQIPPEMLQARVVLIYKKGNTSKLENDRPISLLNSIYKIYAAWLYGILSHGLNPHLQKNTIWLPKT